jgi:hypothetical protein
MTFVDIFEVRGFQRRRRGEALAPVVGERSVELGYRGLDGAVRRTRIAWSIAPVAVHPDWVEFEIEIAPRQKVELETVIGCALEAPCLPTSPTTTRAAPATIRCRASATSSRAFRAPTTSSTRGCIARPPT